MQVLKDYYNGWRNKLLILCIPCWLIFHILFDLITAFFTAYIEKCAVNPKLYFITSDNKLYFLNILSLLLDLIAPISSVAFLYFFGLNYINQKAWKKKFPQYDVSGLWLDTTQYTRGIDDTGWIVPNGNTVPSPVIIEQTCLKVKVEASICNDFMWHSLLANWGDNNNLKILYEVEYYDTLQAAGYPERRVGFEDMHINTADLSLGQRPNKMVGKFWHCISNDGKPMYMGDVTYERR